MGRYGGSYWTSYFEDYSGPLPQGDPTYAAVTQNNEVLEYCYISGDPGFGFQSASSVSTTGGNDCLLLCANNPNCAYATWDAGEICTPYITHQALPNTISLVSGESEVFQHLFQPQFKLIDCPHRRYMPFR
jgi:hypothetical protein